MALTTSDDRPRHNLMLQRPLRRKHARYFTRTNEGAVRHIWFLCMLASSLQLIFSRSPMMTVAFVPSVGRRFPITSSTLNVMIAPENAEMEYRQRRSNDDDDVSSSSSSWKEVAGGFVPQLGNLLLRRRSAQSHLTEGQSHVHQEHAPTKEPPSMQSSTAALKPQSFKIRQVSTLQDYKRFVVDDVQDDVDTITVVRFYAPWCRACQAVQQRFYRLAQQYEQQKGSSSQNSPKTVVRFIECPVTKDNAVLHQGLGVPSLPYGHIYHSAVGLVEELKLNKNVFSQFEEVLASYVRGSCPLPEENEHDTTALA
jgi:thiol-disulfide isomerase/thioredoxin